LGVKSIADLPPDLGETIVPDKSKSELYGAALAKQRGLYKRLFEEPW
jgi:hypothetical protein